MYEDAKQVDLVLELCTGGELWSRIQVKHYTEAGKLNATTCILKAMQAYAQQADVWLGYDRGCKADQGDLENAGAVSCPRYHFEVEVHLCVLAIPS